MSNGSFEDFRDALRAFESGWDRERYEDGIIANWQLDQWAGASVTDIFPQYTSWGDLTDAEWDAMSYRSMNTLGFVGYQFGEALLIDLGYYDDDVYYGNGASRNTWDGTWTGKNGVNSLEEFTTEAAQETAIQEAFGFNLQIIERGLGFGGESLDDYLGTTRTYVQNGVEVTVELTLTGIMAAAHLRGAFGTLALLQGGSVSTDEFGTSILRYIDQFGGYDAPTVDEAIAFYEDRVTGDEGLGTPGGGNTGSGGETGDTGSGTGGGIGDDGNDGANLGRGTADVDATTATVVITWSWGQDAIITGFNPAEDAVFVDWIGATSIEVTETAEGVVFSVPSNNQTTTLAGVTLDDLSEANFTILDASAAQEILSLIGNEAGAEGGTGDAGDTSDPVDTGDAGDIGDTSDPVDTGDTGDTGDAGDTGDIAGGSDGVDTVTIGWNWGGNEVIPNFDPSEDVLDFGHLGAGQLEISEQNGDLVIEVLNNGGNTYTLENVQAEDLSANNLTAAPWSTSLEGAGGVVDQLAELGFNDYLI
ncbi:MAG: hypothetical protein AAFX39_01190 [Pseudomonadota bacterium]